MDITKEEIEIRPGMKLVFVSGLTVNLLFHVLNIYTVLYGHGISYTQRPDITNLPDPNWKKILAQKDDDNPYYNGITAKFVASLPATVDDLIKLYASGNQFEQVLAKALQRSWQRFYKDYWRAHSARLDNIVRENIASKNWPEQVKTLELVAGRTFQNDIYILAAEALQGSAMLVKPNIIMGHVSPGFCFGFFHEGLHLLLNEDWAKDPRVKGLVPPNWNHPLMWGKYWERKFEQAIVVSLDILIQNREEDPEYFAGCHVGDVEKIFFPALKEWYEKPSRENLTDAIYRILGDNKKELIDVFSINKKL